MMMADENALHNIIKSTQAATEAETKSAMGEAFALPPVHLWDPPYCGDIGLKIARDGTWFYQGSPIGRKNLVKLFSSILRHDEDGQFYLVTPVEKILVTVEDAPFLAVTLDIEGTNATQNLFFTTHIGERFMAGRHHPLRVEIDDEASPTPYVLVRARLEALITRAVFYQLVDLCVTEQIDGTAQFGVWSDGVFFPISAAAELNIS